MSNTQDFTGKKFKIKREQHNVIYEVYSQRSFEKIYFWNTENHDEQYNCSYEEFTKNLELENWVLV